MFFSFGVWLNEKAFGDCSLHERPKGGVRGGGALPPSPPSAKR
jgi:hypothetical protein